MPKKILISLYFLSLTAILLAQQNKNISVFEAKLHGGYVIQNWLSDSFPKRSVMVLTQLSFEKQSLGGKVWHQLYGFPQIGLSVFAGDLGNTKELGQLLGFVPSLTFNTLKQGRWNAKISLGIGLSAFNKPFNSETNKENVLIGSRITNLSFAQLYFTRKIGPRTEYLFGLSVIHASNGHYQIPNVGLNAPSVFFGGKYRFNEIKETLRTEKKQFRDDPIRFNIKIGIGVHEFAETTKPIGTSKYAIYTGLLYVSKRFGTKNIVHAGLSAKYYNSYYQFYRRDSIFTTNLHLKSNVFSLLFGHEFMFGHISFLTQLALDIYFPEYKPYCDMVLKQEGFSKFVERWFSTRLGFQYYLKDTFTNTRNNIFLGTYINANFGEADFIELGAGYVF